MDFAFVILLIVINCIHCKSNDRLLYYETLNTEDFAHSIMRRAINQENFSKRISFNSHGEHFRLNLLPSHEIFSPSFEAVVINKKQEEQKVSIDKSLFYHGYDELHSSSEVIAHIEDGMIDAKISTSDETYFIEPMWRHDHPTHDMIVYKASNVNSSLINNNNKSASCGVNDSFNANVDNHRIRRETNTDKVVSKNICHLILVGDYLFYKHMGGSSVATTINYMLQVVDRVNSFYKTTNWDGVGNNIGFQVKKAVVYDSFSEVKPSFNQKRDSWNVDTLLAQFSYENWQGYCLAHLFTYQDFARGVIGLAYVANPSKSAVGGICTKPYQDKYGKRYLNCGLSSSLNWGRRLLTMEANLVTAHELGHNFGSGHDPNSCAPSSTEGGKYIMYATSVSGELPNNKIFSPCSKSAIGKVLAAKRTLCFQDKENSFCGNNIVEDKEECDEGFEASNRKCCDANCKLLHQGFQCSDINHQCCRNCYIASSTLVCRGKSEISCQDETKCDGVSKDCPEKAPPLSDKECGFSKGVCVKGDCKPLCSVQIPPKVSCKCSSADLSCKICCSPSNTSSSCSPLLSNDRSNINENDGVPCSLKNKQGQCVSGKCEESQKNVEDEFSSLLKDFTFSKFARFMEANIVGTILVFSLMIWIPASCIVHYIDKKSDEETAQMRLWQDPQNTDLVQKLTSDKFRMLFRAGGKSSGAAKKLPRTQYHISS